ncbi:hypothetical protein Tco_1504929 [Tanacetum coccineum]
MVSVTIHQDTSTIPLMTSPVIDLVSVPDSPTVHQPLPTTTTASATTTTTIMTTIPLPPQPQQVSSDSILINRLGELEQHIADLVDANQALEERLDKHGSRLYRERFRDLPEADIVKKFLTTECGKSTSNNNFEAELLEPITEDTTCYTEPACPIPHPRSDRPNNNKASALSLPIHHHQRTHNLGSYRDMATNIYCSKKECHKLLTDQVDNAILKVQFSKPLPLLVIPGPALSISEDEAANYPEVA